MLFRSGDEIGIRRNKDCQRSIKENVYGFLEAGLLERNFQLLDSGIDNITIIWESSVVLLSHCNFRTGLGIHLSLVIFFFFLIVSEDESGQMVAEEGN